MRESQVKCLKQKSFLCNNNILCLYCCLGFYFVCGFVIVWVCVCLWVCVHASTLCVFIFKSLFDVSSSWDGFFFHISILKCVISHVFFSMFAWWIYISKVCSILKILPGFHFFVVVRTTTTNKIPIFFWFMNLCISNQKYIFIYFFKTRQKLCLYFCIIFMFF